MPTEAANDDYSGESHCVAPGSSVRNLKDWDFNDDVESAKTVSAC